MVDREYLEQLPDSELDKLFQEKKTDYDQRSTKYKRIQDLLRHKGTRKEKKY